MNRTLVLLATLLGLAACGSLSLTGAPTDGGGNGTTDGGPGSGGGYCGSLAGPSVAGQCCSSCTAGSGSCQANGCYDGWYCDPAACKCTAPPTTCTAGGGGGNGGGSDGGPPPPPPPPPPPSGTVKVLFDDAHAEQAGNADWIVDDQMPTPAPANPTQGTDWNGAYSSFGVALVRTGHFQVETLPRGGRLTYGQSGALDLSNFGVLVLPEPNDTFSSSEIRAIDAFVRAGGGLLAISDHGGADRNHSGADAVQILNALFASDAFGVHLDGNKVSGTARAVSGDPLTTGPYGSVSTLGCWDGSTATLDTGTNPSVHRVSTLSGGAFDSAGTLGAGRFVVHGDSSTADDGTATNWTKPSYDAWDESGYQDAAFFMNAVAWLAGG